MLRNPAFAAVHAAVMVYAVTCLPATLAAQARAATHLITHNEVTIARPAAAVWPYIVDPAPWKQGNKLRHQAGPEGAVGEVFAAVNMRDSTQVDYFVENVELEPQRRRTIKLTSTTGVLIGFASFALSETNGMTTVGYHVYTETAVPPSRLQETTAQSLRESERAGREASSRRFQAELVALKAMLEGR